MYSTYHEFCSCWDLIVCKLAIHNEWSKCPSPESVHARTTSHYVLLHPFEGPGGCCERFDGHKKNGLVKCHFILSWSWIHLGVLSVLTDENLRKGMRSGEHGGCTSTVSVCGRILIWNLFIFFWCGETHSWSFSEHFRCTLNVHSRHMRVHVNRIYTGLFISSSGISELDCTTTKTDTAERSISIGRETLQVFFFVLGALAYFQVPPLGG